MPRDLCYSLITLSNDRPVNEYFDFLGTDLDPDLQFTQVGIMTELKDLVTILMIPAIQKRSILFGKLTLMAQKSKNTLTLTPYLAT